MQRIDDYIKKAKSLPPAPKVLPQLMQLLGKTDIDNDQVVQLIQFEPALTAKLLQVCNSSVFGGARQIADVNEAVVRIGFGEVFRIVASVVSEQALSGPQSGYGLGRGELWIHSAVTAVATRLIARDCQLNENVAFTAGLLHDLGKIVLANSLEKVYAQIVEETETKRHSLLEAEREILGADHAQVGSALLKEWKFPEEMIEAVRGHHEPTLIPDPQHQKLAACTYLGNLISNFTGHGYGHQAFALQGRSESLDILGMKPDALPLYMIKTLEESKQVQKMAA